MKPLKLIVVTFFFATPFFASAQNFCNPYCALSSYYIDNFAFHTLVNNHSSHNFYGYSFYSDSVFTTHVKLGKTYPVSISEYETGGLTNFAIWIDFNNDSIFSASELVYYDSLNYSGTYGYITIPNNPAFTGKRLLRVMHANTKIPCGSFNSGEAEDYVINIETNLPDTQTYCMPFEPKDTYADFIINDFQVNTLLNNNSGCDSADYTFYPPSRFTTNLAINGTYPVSISKDVNAGISGSYAIWIDLDNNGDFSDSEKLFSAGPNLTTVFGTITIPNDTNFIGIRRLRVRSSWAYALTPCGLGRAGETEDYLVNITKPESVPNVPNYLNDITLYPNPANDRFYFSCPFQNKNFTATIMNALGQSLFTSGDISQNKAGIDISTFPTGIYYVRVGSQSSEKWFKLVKN